MPYPELLSCYPRVSLFVAALVLQASAIHAAGEGLTLPADLSTVPDGRATIHQLYSSYDTIIDRGWQLDVITHSKPAGTGHEIPIIALRTAHAGPAIWIISGIHGEEPAGPNAIANVIDDIIEAGERRPIVLVPLANPHGYVRNWRYLNAQFWSADVEAQSVGDASHMLADSGNPAHPRAAGASSTEADAITRYVVDLLPDYPPLVSIDLHEDDKISAGYVYSQGAKGASDPLAAEAVRVLSTRNIPIKLDGKTRFGEPIINGIIGPVTDSSIDEFMSAKEIMIDGAMHAGPAAPTVLVFETPAGELPLGRRIEAHEALIRRMLMLGADSGN